MFIVHIYRTCQKIFNVLIYAWKTETNMMGQDLDRDTKKTIKIENISNHKLEGLFMI